MKLSDYVNTQLDVNPHLRNDYRVSSSSKNAQTLSNKVLFIRSDRPLDWEIDGEVVVIMIPMLFKTLHIDTNFFALSQCICIIVDFGFLSNRSIRSRKRSCIFDLFHIGFAQKIGCGVVVVLKKYCCYRR